MVSSLTRHLYRHRRVTPSSCANSLTSSQVLRRSTASRWNFREYRFLFTLQPFPCKVCPSRLSHFKGAVHFWGEPLRWPKLLGHRFAVIRLFPRMPSALANDQTADQRTAKIFFHG